MINLQTEKTKTKKISLQQIEGVSFKGNWGFASVEIIAR